MTRIHNGAAMRKLPEHHRRPSPRLHSTELARRKFEAAVREGTDRQKGGHRGNEQLRLGAGAFRNLVGAEFGCSSLIKRRSTVPRTRPSRGRSPTPSESTSACSSLQGAGWLSPEGPVGSRTCAGCASPAPVAAHGHSPHRGDRLPCDVRNALSPSTLTALSSVSSAS